MAGVQYSSAEGVSTNVSEIDPDIRWTGCSNAVLEVDLVLGSVDAI
jgi:hypothetical protein